MTVYDVDGYDLNFWYDGAGWKANAYPYDKDGEFIGEHMAWLNMELSVYDVAELKLGDPANEYVGADDDFWADARWMISDYPHLSASFMPKIIALPKQVKFVNSELMKVEE